MTARTIASTTLPCDTAAESHATPHTARHAATESSRRGMAATTAVTRRTRWAMAAAVTAAAAGAITASAGAAHAATPAASPAGLTSQMLAVKPILPLPADVSGQATAPSAAPAGSASAQPATDHTATAQHTAPAQHAIAKPATTTPHATARPAIAKPAAQAGPSTIYDSVTPSSIPAGADAAVYADGTYQAATAQVAGHKHVLWIDTNGSRTDANVLDVEPGDATPAGAGAWVQAKLTTDPSATAIVYTFKSDWAPVTSAISALPKAMQSHVKYWIADPTGTPHILPGAAATQWYWGPSYDISAAQPGFIK